MRASHIDRPHQGDLPDGRQYADTVDLPQVLADIREFANEDPLFWQPSPLLVDLVERGANFDNLNKS